MKKWVKWAAYAHTACLSLPGIMAVVSLGILKKYCCKMFCGNYISYSVKPYQGLHLYVWSVDPAFNCLTLSQTKMCVLHLALCLCIAGWLSHFFARQRPLSPIRRCPKGRKLLQGTIFHNLLREGLFTRGEVNGSIGYQICV